MANRIEPRGQSQMSAPTCACPVGNDDRTGVNQRLVWWSLISEPLEDVDNPEFLSNSK